MMIVWVIAWIQESWVLLVEMAPWLVLGFLAAGLLHAFLPRGWIQRHLSDAGWRGIWKAALMGTPLPLCSCGVIPMAQFLRKEGASRSATMSFLVSTPMTGVDSILATYAMMGPWFAFARVLAAVISGLLAGLAVSGSEKRETVENVVCAAPPSPDEQRIFLFKDKIAESLRYGFGDLLNDVSRWLLLGIVVGGGISAFVPDGFLGSWGSAGVWVSYGVMMFLGIPFYVCAMGSIPIAASLVDKGVSPGAALLFLLVGPATNVATLAFVRSQLGRRNFWRYLGVIGGVGLSAAVGFDALDGHLKFSMGHDHGAGSAVEILSVSCAVFMAVLLFLERWEAARRWISRYGSRGKKFSESELEWRIDAMTCGHCAQRVEVLAKTAGARQVFADVASRRVRFTGVQDPEALRQILTEGGYPPEKY